MIDIANKGALLQSVAFTGRRSTLAIVSEKKKKPLAKPQNLVGNRIGIPSEGGTRETTLDLLLASDGIATDKVPRQVTGFTPGSFELIKKGRIAGFVIGASQEEQSREAQPDSMFLPTADYVTDGLSYVTSQTGLQSSADQIKAYMRGLKGAMQQILEDKKKGYPDTLKKLRSKYDFDELKKDSVAKAYLDFNVGSWVIDGEDRLLTTDPEKWRRRRGQGQDGEGRRGRDQERRQRHRGVKTRSAPEDGSPGARRTLLCAAGQLVA